MTDEHDPSHGPGESDNEDVSPGAGDPGAGGASHISPDMPTKAERDWAMAAHLSGLAGYLPIIPGLGSLIAPLVIWLIKREEMAFVEDQGKEAVNFQIAVLIVAVILGIFSFIPLVFCITLPLLAVVLVIHVIYCILAAIAASRGEAYRYPVLPEGCRFVT
jgi:uncharacterized Tic20 family protein